MGRAGRDNNAASDILFYQSSDISKIVKHVSKDMKMFCLQNTCRRESITKFFDQEPSFEGSKCLCCDICKAKCSCNLLFIAGEEKVNVHNACRT